ncbi:MAG TPA: o-succinylbenzoate synthase [Kiritimatiellia bacterium]|nr:o-succinylbenzoate synthase [Kiritimatiellia bacterium]
MNFLKSIAPSHWPTFRFYRYTLPLRRSLKLKNSVLNERRGIVVCCERNGIAGWGEIAPLEGFSNETLEQVMVCIPDIVSALNNRESIENTMPSVCCGIEFAMAQFHASHEGRSLYLMMGGFPERTHVAVAKLITHCSVSEALSEVTASLKQGFQCFKIKVGSSSLDQDIELVRAVQRMIPAKVGLRLDANRSWSLEQALRFSNSIEATGIEYIEEPLMPGQSWEDYSQNQSLPWALDESLAMLQPDSLPALKNLVALVIKPTLLGGITPALKWRNWAGKHECFCSISSTFESGVGMIGLLAMAGAKFHDRSAGLDTYSMLADDIIKPPIEIKNGRMGIYQSFQKNWQIDFDKLDQIA